nr:Ohr family peroxiredoxin [Bacillus subtilis]
MSQPLFTATVSAVGGREGKVISSDRVLELDVAMPGTPRAKKLEKATNPEQLFAAGYANFALTVPCSLVARTERVKVETEVTANVSLLKDEADQGYKLGVTPQVKGEGVSASELEALVKKAHGVCPYSKATSGNIDVTLEVAE